ncbi:HECT E3 ubiquitin ligase, partial [Thraustotheca clavata]
LAIYIYIFLGAMVFVGVMSLFAYCYHQRRLQRYVEHDNLNNNMQRHSLIDSFIEHGESEWQCSVCYHDNHPAKRECLLCGTPQVVLQQSIATPRLRQIGSIPNGLSADQAENNSLQFARQRSFHVRRLNAYQENVHLNQRQRGARRRNLWRREKGEDGQLRWVRVDDCKPRVSVLAANTVSSSDSAPEGYLFDMQTRTSFSHRSSTDAESVGTELRLSSNSPKPPKDVVLPRVPLVAQDSAGYVRDTDEQGNVKWVPADTVRMSEVLPIDTEEFPRSTGIIDFEYVASLPFRHKVRWFLHELDKVAVPWEEGHLLLKIRRDAVLSESFHLLMMVPASDLRQRLRIEFIDEPGLDAGGLLREWVLLLCEHLFDESYGLFQSTHVENMGYWINVNSAQLHEDHQKSFEFIGRLIAKCLLEGQLLTVHFALPLLKHILGVPISFSDLEFLDEELCKNASWLRTNTGVENLCLDFTVQMFDASGKSLPVKELKPNGANIAVTDANKEEYLNLLLKHYMFDSVQDQVTSLLKGLFDVIPRNLLTVFDYQELELLICGVPKIDVDDWERHSDVKYQDFDHGSPAEICVVEWFWTIVRAFTQEQRARLLQFVTGTSRVPVEGFKGLLSNDGRVRRFGIQIVSRGVPPTGLYPKAHTCFNRIDIPLYESKEELATYLTLVINMEITGFTMQ